MEATQATPASESTAPKTRRTKSRAHRDLIKTIEAMDALLPALQDKPAKCADVLCEKAAALKTLLAIEAEEEESGQAEKISTLEQQLEADQRRMSELTAENLRLTSPKIERIPDPGASNVRWERDGLKSALNALAKTLTLDQKAQAAVAFAHMCQPQEKVESFCRTIGLEYSRLTYTLPLSVATLEAAQGGTGVGGCLARAVLQIVHRLGRPTSPATSSALGTITSNSPGRSPMDSSAAS